jgi:hypothetical protein
MKGEFFVKKPDFFPGEAENMLVFEHIQKCGNRLPAVSNELGNFFMGQVIGSAYFPAKPFGAILQFSEQLINKQPEPGLNIEL